MTDVDWPATLPQYFQQSGYNEGNVDNVIETKMTTGPSKARPKSTEALLPVSGNMLMTTTQKNTFDTFYKTDIAFGALPFNFPDPANNLSTVEARLKSRTFTPVSGNAWSLKLSLEFII